MKKVLGLVLVLLFITATAYAAPIALPEGPVYFQFNNMEQVSGANDLVVPGGYNGMNTQGNWGVVNVSTMQYGGIATDHVDISGGPAFFADFGALPHAQITGIFYDIQITGANTATGGYLDIYWNDAGTIDAACLNGGCGPDATTVSLFTSGTFLARLMFDTGILSDGSNTTIQSSTDPTTLGGSGQADSFASVVLTGNGTEHGVWTDTLNGNWFYVYPDGLNMETRDVRFSNFFNNTLQSTWGDGDVGDVLGLRSNDPGRVYLVAVPEPGTLALLGIGLLGLGFFRRKK